MTRKEEIKQAGLYYANNLDDIKPNDEFSKNLCIALGQAYIKGAEWADNHPNLTWEDIRKICLIAKNVHKYYGFWSQNVYEEILNRFCKPEIWS